MKTPIRATKGRRKVAGPTDTALSNAEQVDRAENEGMTVRSKKPSTAMHKRQQPAESTSLERRVLAHERILQSLIAHMTETDPRFLDRLKETYNIQIKYHEQNYTDTEDFAEEFVRAIEEAIIRQQNKSASQASAAIRGQITAQKQDTKPAMAKPERFQIRNRNGIWEVKENGHFFGDFVREEQAINAVRIAEQKR
jgi:hypothetical protein